MTILRSFSALALLLALLAGSSSADLVHVAEWNAAGEAFRLVESLTKDLEDHPAKAVAKPAAKATRALATVIAAIDRESLEDFFKQAAKAQKKVDRLTAKIAKAGDPTVSAKFGEGCAKSYTSARDLLLSLIVSVKERPDFIDSDRLVKAAARAEVMIEKGAALIARGKPWGKALKALGKGFTGLNKVI